MKLRRQLTDFLLLILLVLLAWELIRETVGEHAMSSPIETIAYLITYVQSSAFWINAKASLISLGWAMLIACAVGLAIGLPLGYYRQAGDIADPFLVALFSMPKITLYPVILLIFGLTIWAKIAFGAIHGVFPIVLFTISGIRSIPRSYLKSARSLQLSTFETIRCVIVPAALPEIVTGIRIGLSATILGTLIGEMFAGTDGLGFVLIKALERNNVVLIMTLTLLIFLVASAVNAVLLALDHRLHRRRVTA